MYIHVAVSHPCIYLVKVQGTRETRYSHANLITVLLNHVCCNYCPTYSVPFYGHLLGLVYNRISNGYSCVCVCVWFARLHGFSRHDGRWLSFMSDLGVYLHIPSEIC